MGTAYFHQAVLQNVEYHDCAQLQNKEKLRLYTAHQSHASFENILMQQISGGESLSTNRATEVALYSRKLDHRF